MPHDIASIRDHSTVKREIKACVSKYLYAAMLGEWCQADWLYRPSATVSSSPFKDFLKPVFSPLRCCLAVPSSRSFEHVCWSLSALQAMQAVHYFFKD